MMALSFIDPKIAEAISGQFMAGYNQKNPGYEPFTSANQDGLSDQAPADATFDTQHEVYTNPWVDGAAQQSILDNSDFPADATLTATLSYSYTTGYSTEHVQTQAVTVGVTQDFDFKFEGAGEGTTLSASGTFSWTEGTSEDHTSTISSGVQESLVVPAGKIYEAKILYHQEEVSVPYSWSATIAGSYVMYFADGSVLNNIGVTFGDASSPSVFGPLPPTAGVDWSDFQRSGPGPAPGNNLSFTLNGTLSVQGASAYTIKNYDITNQNSVTEVTEAPVSVSAAAPLAVGDPAMPVAAAPAAIHAAYDPAVPIGVHQILDDAGRAFVASPFDDWVDGGAGADKILLHGGEDIAHAGGGDDLIQAVSVGRSLLNGGDGDDVIHLISTASYGTVLGGVGNDRIHVDAPAAMLYGGAGDDFYALKGATAGGTVITDSEGSNRLDIDEGRVPVHFERVPESDNLYILVGGGETYDRSRDVVWVDFFANPENRVNGHTTAEVAEVTVTFSAPPALPDAQPATAQSTGAEDLVIA
jgi:hypothetical protein